MNGNLAWLLRLALAGFFGFTTMSVLAQDTPPVEPVAPPPVSTPAPPPAAPDQSAPAPAPEQRGINLAEMTVPQILDLADSARVAQRYTDANNLINVIVQREGGENSIDVLRLLGEIAYDMRKAEDARKNWLLVRKILPGDFGANWGLGRVELDSGQPRNAILYLEAAERVLPSNKPELAPKLLVRLAQAYGDPGVGARTQAVDAAQRALKLDPKNLDAWYILTKLHADMARTADDFDKALGDADQLIAITDADMKTNGISPATVQQMQVAYQLKQAVLYEFRSILFEKNPDGKPSDRLLPGQGSLVAKILNSAVDVMLQQAELTRLSTHLTITQMAEEVVRYDGGTNVNTLMKLANLQTATGQYKAAIESFKRVLGIDPAHQEAQRQLDTLQAQSPQAPAPSAP